MLDDGQRLRLTGRGPAAPRGGMPGDLYVTVRVAPDPRFERQGDDLLHVRKISRSAKAALGCAIEVETLKDEPEELLTVAARCRPGHVFRLKTAAGFRRCAAAAAVTSSCVIDVDVPGRLSAEEDALVRQLAEVRGEAVAAAQDKGVFSRLKSAFDVVRTPARPIHARRVRLRRELGTCRGARVRRTTRRRVRPHGRG